MITTFVFDRKGQPILVGSDEAGWLVRSTESPWGWTLPHATNFGSVGNPSAPIHLALWLAIHDGVVDHVGCLAGSDPVAREAARELRTTLVGARVGDVRVESEGLPATATWQELSAVTPSASELARTALASALRMKA